MAPKAVIYPVRGLWGKVRGYKFKVIGGNGERQGSEELYDSRSNARRGVADLRETMAKLTVVEEED